MIAVLDKLLKRRIVNLHLAILVKQSQKRLIRQIASPSPLGSPKQRSVILPATNPIPLQMTSRLSLAFLRFMTRGKKKTTLSHVLSV